MNGFKKSKGLTILPSAFKQVETKVRMERVTFSVKWSLNCYSSIDPISN